MNDPERRPQRPSKPPRPPARRKLPRDPALGLPGPRVWRPGPIGVRPLEPRHELFALVHPQGVEELSLDYEDAIEAWRSGDPELAQDLFRDILSECREHLGVHVALGQLALELHRDRSLAQGHFGYVLELVERAFPPGFRGILPDDHPANRPVYDAIEGLIACCQQANQTRDVADLVAFARRLRGQGGPR